MAEWGLADLLFGSLLAFLNRPIFHTSLCLVDYGQELLHSTNGGRERGREGEREWMSG